MIFHDNPGRIRSFPIPTIISQLDPLIAKVFLDDIPGEAMAHRSFCDMSGTAGSI
jgi:hypothetical protein